MTPPTPFLKLPGEIRNAIYDSINPFEHAAKDFIGMYLSCKQIHEEILGATQLSADKFLTEVENGWKQQCKNPLVCTRPKTYKDCNELAVRFPATSMTLRSTAGLNDNEQLASILRLPTDTIRLEIYDDTRIDPYLKGSDAVHSLELSDYSDDQWPATIRLFGLFCALRPDGTHWCPRWRSEVGPSRSRGKLVLDFSLRPLPQLQATAVKEILTKRLAHGWKFEGDENIDGRLIITLSAREKCVHMGPA